MSTTRRRCLTGMFVLSLLVAACSSGGGRKNPPPRLGDPTGPGAPTGTAPDFVATVNTGDSLALTITATDKRKKDTLTLRATVTGGTLTAAQAGFTQAFPATVSGPSPLTLSLDGTAATGGTITLSFEADDGRPPVGPVTLAITIVQPNSPPGIGSPTGPGAVGGSDPAYSAAVGTGGSLDLDVTVTDADASDTLGFSALVTGGSLTAAQAGFAQTFPVAVSGTTPQTISLTGTAGGTPGDIVLTFAVDDGQGGSDTITHTITIGNAPPRIGPPTGPGTLSGSDPAYTAAVSTGATLDFSVTATDPNPTDTLALTATATGGTLTPAQAGFATAFPAMTTGPSPLSLILTGTAAMTGSIEITLAVDDGNGGNDSITHTIQILAPGPRVTGFARFADENRNGQADVGDTLVIRFDENVTVNGASTADLDLPVAGDAFGAGATVAAGPGADEVTVVLGTSPTLKTRQTFSPGALQANDASGVDVSASLAADAIESATTGDDAVPSIPVDLTPGFVDSTQSLGNLYTVGVALADLDADGDLDVVDTDILGGGARVWTNAGTGVFADSGQSLGATQMQSVAVGDVDRDGDPDLVTGSGGAAPNQVWWNDGAGLFTDSGQTLGSGDTHAVALADLDADGWLDLVAGNASAQGNRVYINDRAGNLVDSGQSLGTGDTWSIALGDADRDGDVDLVTGNDALQPNRLWRNDGAGVFADSGQTIGAESTRTVALGDVDRDGDLDLVYGNVIDPAEVWWNDGAGGFTDSGQALGSGGMEALLLVDHDGDGDPDLIGASSIAGGSIVFLNDGQGTLAASGETIGAANTTALAAGDLDRDGDLDLLEGIDGGNRVWMGSLSGTWGTATLVETGSLGTTSSYAVILGDVDRDGDPDAIVGVDGGGNRVWRNDGSGQFTDTGQDLGSADTWGLALGDVDRDGDLDLATANRSSTANRIWTNDGAGNFVDSGQALGADTTSDVKLADLDGDGDLDLFAGNSVLLPDRVYLNDGLGVFTDSGQALGTDTTAFVSLGDVDGDADLDAFTMHTAGSPTAVQIRLWYNDGAAVFTDSGQGFSGGSIGYSSDLGDVDRDGDLDLARGGAGSNTFWSNDGAGIFTDSGQGLGTAVAFSTLLGDVDGDGDLDVFYGNISGPNELWWNDGLGIFSDSGLVLGSGNSYGGTMGDVDRDGDLDVISANSGSTVDRIFTNE